MERIKRALRERNILGWAFVAAVTLLLFVQAMGILRINAISDDVRGTNNDLADILVPGGCLHTYGVYSGRVSRWDIDRKNAVRLGQKPAPRPRPEDMENTRKLIDDPKCNVEYRRQEPGLPR